MSDGNKIYEITQMMGNNQVIRGDVNQAAGVIRAMLNEKYITPITKAIAAENRKVRKNPCKEARLLDALKPFVDVSNHETLEKTIEALYMIETLRGLSSNIPKVAVAPNQKTRAASLSPQDSSVHTDGIYDIDERCFEHKRHQPLMPIIAIMALCALAANNQNNCTLDCK